MTKSSNDSPFPCIFSWNLCLAKTGLAFGVRYAAKPSYYVFNRLSSSSVMVHMSLMSHPLSPIHSRRKLHFCSSVFCWTGPYIGINISSACCLKLHHVSNRWDDSQSIHGVRTLKSLHFLLSFNSELLPSLGPWITLLCLPVYQRVQVHGDGHFFNYSSHTELH